MLFWTPILEYIKIRPSQISKLSPDALIIEVYFEAWKKLPYQVIWFILTSNQWIKFEKTTTQICFFIWNLEYVSKSEEQA